MFDYIYSRFTLHAINEEQEGELLHNVYSALMPGGKFFIEVRTIHDDLYGKGTMVSRNAFNYDNHYRRFIDSEEFRAKLEQYGFCIVSLDESTGFSITDSSDPVLLRCVCTK